MAQKFLRKSSAEPQDIGTAWAIASAMKFGTSTNQRKNTDVCDLEACNEDRHEMEARNDRRPALSRARCLVRLTMARQLVRAGSERNDRKHYRSDRRGGRRRQRHHHQ